MAKFAVSITETLSKLVAVEAENENDALDIVEDLWKDGEIVLTSEDFIPDPDFQIEDKDCIEDCGEIINAKT